MSFLIPEVFIILLCDIIFLCLLTISLWISFDIAKNWNIESTDNRQYQLEKRASLINVLIKYILILKIPLFILFIYANDKLANVLPGAMCAAGSVSATSYGKYLLYMKIFNIYAFSSWLAVNRIDSRYETLPFTRLKAFLIFPIYALFLTEFTLFILNFASIDPTIPVSCCSTLFSEDSSSLMSIGGLNSFIIFSVNAVFLLVFYFMKKPILYLIANTTYIFTSILSLILITGTYVYELPTHLCPFCMLQSGYSYIGYLFYVLIFIGTFTGIASYIELRLTKKYSIFLMRLSISANLVFYLISALYPAIYYLRHHTWL